MSEPVTQDPFGADLALGASGLLGEANRAGVLSAADVHVARRLGVLGGEADERVLLAAALTVRGARSGSVCIDLADASRLDPELAWPDLPAWATAVRGSVLVGPGRPLRWDADLLHLDRYWRQEVQVCDDLLARDDQPPPVVDELRLRAGLERLFPGDSAQEQRRATRTAATWWTTVLGGGPGTGKTTTVAGLLALLLDQPGPPPRIALAAPTGKAAARLQEAVQQAVRQPGAGFDDGDRARLGAVTASTLHRLLGSRPGAGTRFRHDRDDRLPYDVVVVDETSMVSLTLMARLLEALRPDARLVLVGDPDQLASVEAGAVLADLVAGLSERSTADGRPRVVVLDRTWRFGGAIADLATAVRDGDEDAALAVLRSGGEDVAFDPLPAGTRGGAGVRDDVVTTALAVRAAAADADAALALEALGRHRLLCAHRTGPFGVDAWSRQIERWLAATGIGREGEWPVGRPLLVTANDYGLGLFNGDTGVVVREPDGSVRAVFARGGGLVRYAPSRLSSVQTVHAMTVHRSQGSQFERVTLVLPEEDSPLLTRELLYTALTRAQRHVRVVGTEEAVRAAVRRPAVRASGLRRRLSRAADADRGRLTR